MPTNAASVRFPSRAAEERGAALIGLGLLLLWHWVLRGHGFSLPLMSDEGEYAYAARIWAEGGLPYRDAFCQKPPMIFLLYRLADFLFPGWTLAPRALAAVFSSLTMVLLYRLTPAHWKAPARLAPAAAFGTLSPSPIGSFGFAANTEVFLCAFAALGALGVRNSLTAARPLLWLALGGAASGLAFATKQTALWTAAAFGVVSVWSSPKERGARGAVFALSAAAPLALFGAYFHWRGGLGYLIDDVLKGNLAYAGVALSSPDFPDHLRWFFLDVLPRLALPGLPAAALAAWALAATEVQKSSLETLATLWLAAGLIGAATGLLLFPYYFLQALPALALLAGAGLQRIQESRRGARLTWGLAAALALWPGLAGARSFFRERGEILAKSLFYPNPLFEIQVLADYIRAHSAPSDAIYVFGSEPHLYVYARRRAATRYIFSYPLTFFPKDEAMVREEARRVEAARPRFILYSAQRGSTMIARREGLLFRDLIQGLLRRDYRLVGEVAIFPENSRVRFDARGLGSPEFLAGTDLLLFELR